MSTSANRRTSISPTATTLASTSTTTNAAAAASSSSTNPAETASSSPYFLPELIPLVASRLTTLQDFFALRATCRTYRDLLPPSPANLASQAPLLLVPHNASASEALYHAPLRRLLRFRLPRTRLDSRDPGLTCFHSLGCRVAIDDRNVHSSSRELRVRHLLNGEGGLLPDPPRDFDGVILSGDLVLTFTQLSDVLYYCRIGDAGWRSARCDEGYRLDTLMSMKGALYALVSPNRRLAIVELRNNSAELSFLGDELSALTVQNSSLFWLAECAGELLLVVAVRYSPPVFHVFRWQSGERKWARTASLGGRSLFFNRYQFAGCLGPDHPGVQRDCMYFTWSSGKWSEYSLIDGSCRVVDFPGRAETDDYGALAWVLPSIG